MSFPYIRQCTNLFLDEMKNLPAVFYTASHYHLQKPINFTYDFYHILFVVKGSGVVKSGGKTYELKPGTGFFNQPNNHLEYYGTDDLVTAYLTAYGVAISALSNYLHSEKFIFFKSVDVDRFLLKITKIEDEYNSLRRSAILSALTYAFFVVFLSQNDVQHLDEISKVAHYIENNYSKKLTVPMLANMVHVSVSKLSHDFKKKYNYTLFDFITHIRCENAKIYLRSSNHTISNIASLCGFNSVAYFSTIYKKKYGISPSKERE